jgi:hypothetical protein
VRSRPFSTRRSGGQASTLERKNPVVRSVRLMSVEVDTSLYLLPLFSQLVDAVPFALISMASLSFTLILLVV